LYIRKESRRICYVKALQEAFAFGGLRKKNTGT